MPRHRIVFLVCDGSTITRRWWWALIDHIGTFAGLSRTTLAAAGRKVIVLLLLLLRLALLCRVSGKVGEQLEKLLRRWLRRGSTAARVAALRGRCRSWWRILMLVWLVLRPRNRRCMRGCNLLSWSDLGCRCCAAHNNGKDQWK